MAEKFAVVIQGQSNWVKENRAAWKGFPCIYSTWVGYEEHYEEGETVIYNTAPVIAGPSNYYWQQKSTLEGLYQAKELGYEYALKIRQDLIPTHATAFVDTLRLDSLNFLCWHEHYVHISYRGYFVDYLMAGPIDDLITLWKSEDISSNVPEMIITQQYHRCLHHRPVHFFLNSLCVTNDLYWIKPDVYLSTYQSHPGYRTDIIEVI